MNNERSWVLTGGRVFGFPDFRWARFHSITEGHPCAVACDYKWALWREEHVGDVIGFLHTHPSFLARPSQRDVQTMMAWHLSFGKPMLCAIDGIDGLFGFWFSDDSGNFEQVNLTRLPGRIIIGRGPHGNEISSRTAVSRR